ERAHRPEIRESLVRRRRGARAGQGEPAAAAARSRRVADELQAGGQPVKRAIACALLGIACASALATAEERAAVVMTPGGQTTYRIAVQGFADDRARPNPRVVDDFRDKVLRALEFSNVFTKIEDPAFLGPVTTPPGREDAQLECPNWSQIGADALLEGEFARRAVGIGISFRVWDPTQCKRLVRRRYQQSGANLDATARRLADDVVEAFI